MIYSLSQQIQLLLKQKQQIFTNLYLEMLEKYQNFYKLSKHNECSIYSAFNRQLAIDVLIVKFQTRLEWNDILVHKHLQLMNKSKSFLKMSEIFKNKGFYFLVFDKPYGNSLSSENRIQQFELETFYQAYNTLLQGVKDIQAITPDLVILPQWIFFHRNSLKIVHFQSFLSSTEHEQAQKHVATHLQKQQPSVLLQKSKQFHEIIPEEYKKNLVLNLGIVAYHLLIGKKEENIKNNEQYIQKIQWIRTNCDRHIQKITQDPKLADFITKMISNNQYQAPKLHVVSNFFQSRVKMFKGKQGNKDFDFTIELQKIQLTNHRRNNETEIMKSRKCCIKQQNFATILKTPKKIDLSSRQKIKSNNFLMKINKNKIVLPYLPPNRRHTVMNRHNLSITPANNPKYSNRDHVKSLDFQNQY